MFLTFSRRHHRFGIEHSPQAIEDILKLLLTNDDGIDADGLLSFVECMSHDFDCYVVAPHHERSCCGHGISTHAPITLKPLGDQRWTLNGTPADCVRIGLKYLGIQPDWVISGVNQGGNLGVDVYYSGTVAAAREARLCGVPSMAISQFLRREIARNWTLTAARARWAFDNLVSRTLASTEFWNVNLPVRTDETIHLPVVNCIPEAQHLEFHYEVVSTEPSESEDLIAIQYRGNYQGRPRSNGSDVDVCFQGSISASLLETLSS